MSKTNVQYEQTKNIKRGYIYSLWFMSLLTLFAVYVVTDAVLSHRADSRLINEAGRQRMRMEQIVKHIVWISASKEEFMLKDNFLLINELKEITAKFKQVHHALQSRPNETFEGNNSAQIDILFKNMQSTIDSIMSITNQMTKPTFYTQKNLVDKQRMQSIYDDSTDFLFQMEAVVAKYVADSEEKQMLVFTRPLA